MKSSHSFSIQLRSSRPLIGIVLAVSAFLLGFMVLLHYWKGIPIGDLTRDPTAITEAPLFTGLFSQAGIFFWSASAAVCIFSATVIFSRPDSHEIRRFLSILGITSLFLGLDDAFLFHEGIVPKFLGVPEAFVFASYACFVLFCLVRFYSTILKTSYIVLAMALGFFALSIAADLLEPFFPDQHFVEDGAKLIGLISWTTYFFSVGILAVSRTAPHGASADQ